MNQFIQECDPETTEILTNAYHALEDKEITREQYNEIVCSCIAAETEWRELAPIAERMTV